MRHQKSGRKFGRNPSHRQAMFRNLAGNLIVHEAIQTTDTKAKELRRIAERLITRATRLGKDLTADVSKVGEEEKDRILARRVHARRQVAKLLPKRLTKTLPDGTFEDIDVVRKLFEDIAPRYMNRIQQGKGGGYTRIIKLIPRRGDNAPISMIEFVDRPEASATGAEAPAKA